jgi:hypothetical protein
MWLNLFLVPITYKWTPYYEEYSLPWFMANGDNIFVIPYLEPWYLD